MSYVKPTRQPHNFGRPPASSGPCGSPVVVRFVGLDNPSWPYADSWEAWLIGAGMGDRKRRRIEAVMTEIAKWPGETDAVGTLLKGFDDLFTVNIGVEIWWRAYTHIWAAKWYTAPGHDSGFACFQLVDERWERMPDDA